jgi:hypothetical protein
MVTSHSLEFLSLELKYFVIVKGYKAFVEKRNIELFPEKYLYFELKFFHVLLFHRVVYANCCARNSRPTDTQNISGLVYTSAQKLCTGKAPEQSYDCRKY